MEGLVIPPVAEKGEKSIEMIRVWVANGANRVSLNPHLFRDRNFEKEWACFAKRQQKIRQIRKPFN